MYLYATPGVTIQDMCVCVTKGCGELGGVDIRGYRYKIKDLRRMGGQNSGANI